MKERMLRLDLKWLIAMLLSLSLIIFNGANIDMESWAEESQQMTWQLINYGIYEEGVEEPVILPEEAQDSWIHEKMGDISWKLGIEGELLNIQSVEFYRKGETPESLEIKKEYEIPLKDSEYVGNYRLVVTDTEGNVTEAVQPVKIDRHAPVLEKVIYTPEGNAVKIQDTEYRFYQSAAHAQVGILETNFPNTPEMEKYLPVYAGNGLPGAWTYQPADKQASANIHFPLQLNKETEYDYTLFYEDFAGNLMKGQGVACVDGSYGSERIVVDQKPPVLKRFEVESRGDIPFVPEDGLAYAKNVEGDDVKITVVIDDHPTYFQKNGVLLEYSEDGSIWKPLNAKNDWVISGREHRMVYTFDGLENEERTYQFRVTYADRANNPMVLMKDNTLEVKETEGGTYTSLQKVVIDRKAPMLTNIQFTAPVQMFDGETLEDYGMLTEKITNETTRLYYDKSAVISFSLEDAYLNSSDVAVCLYIREHKGAEWEIRKEKIKIAEQKNGDFQLVLPKKDGEYYVTFSYADRAGNQLMYASEITDSNFGEAYAGGISEGMYRSPVFVKDSIAPVYTVSYEKEPQKYNSVETIKTTLTLIEKNLDFERLEVSVMTQDINGNPITAEEIDRYMYDAKQQKLTLEFSTEAYYQVRVKIADKVQKKAEYENAYCIDRSAPEITVVAKDGREFTNVVNVSSGILDDRESDIVYSVTNNGWFARIINKLTFGYFAQAKMMVHVKVHDAISGVKTFHPTCISEGIEIKDYKVSEKKAVEDDKSIVLYDIELPIDFKGTVQMHAIDQAENKGKDAGGIGMITETEEQHKKYAKTEIEVLTPFDKTPNYYRGDVKIRFFAEDGVSGFYQVYYQAGELQETVNYPAGEQLCQEVTRRHTVTENKNNVKLGLGFLDNAGHLETFEKDGLPDIHIDKTKPKIEIVYDNVDVENEKYYKQERTATIIITERNFDPNDTKVDISGPSVNLGDWKHMGASGCKGGSEHTNTYHVDACEWVAEAHFSKDGEYTLTCQTTDLAGNETSYGKTDVFVIDQTCPEISVVYDNQKVRNGRYYNAPRTAGIEIVERNFDESDVAITLKAENAGEMISIPKINGWTKEGDVYRTEIVFDYDGEFFFDISCTDLAGNTADIYPSDSFVVDLTAPEMIIFDVENESANKGVTAPGIRCLDTHYDPESITIELEGKRNGVLKTAAVKKLRENGLELKLKDFAYEPELDDMYTLRVTSSDLAGNISEETIQFSVNRFGSVYIFDEKTEALVGEKGSYYINQPQELVIFETNVDTLEFREITLNCNGKLKTLVEGKDYQVLEGGDKENWKKYTYRIPAKNFAEEGIYMLTIYSEDRAENISDNHSKGKKIEFAVDWTMPSILITGVEHKKQYGENFRKVTVDVEDNVAVGYMEVLLNGEITRYDALEIAKVHGRVMFNVENSNDWQTMKITAYDAAGNETKSEELKFLITANLFVQFYRNQGLFYGSMGTVAAVGGLLCFFVKKKKRGPVSS